MGRKQSPTDQLHAKQPAERLDRESWLQSVRLQVVNQPVCYVEEFLTGLMPGQLFLLLVSDNVTRVAPCFPDRRILIGEVMIARCLMADEHWKETGETDGPVVLDGLDTPPK